MSTIYHARVVELHKMEDIVGITHRVLAFATTNVLSQFSSKIGKPTECLERRKRKYKNAQKVCAEVSFREKSNDGFLDVARKFWVRDPNAVKIPRKRMKQDFAVSLMRTGYLVTDTLDVIAMQDFQVKFFEIRQREWETFSQDNMPIVQGDLTDTKYFDFISFAQMLTVHEVIRKPLSIFEERYQDLDGNFRSRIIRRDVDKLPDSHSIYLEWKRQMGKRLLEFHKDSLEQRMPELTTIIESPIRDAISVNEVAMILQNVYYTFRDNGFCLDVVWHDDDRNRKASDKSSIVRIELIAPCILWGNHALKNRQCVPNDYDCFVVDALLSSHLGLDVNWKTSFSDSSIIRMCQISSGVATRLIA